MKTVFVNLWGEIPFLLLLAACYIVMERAMFGNRLSKIICEGWAEKLRRLFNRAGKFLPLQPADPRTILKTIDYDEGLAGHMGEVSPQQESRGDASDSFAPADKNGGVVPREDYDRVFFDGRVETDPKTGDEWINPVPPGEPDTPDTYDLPGDYDEMDWAFGDMRQTRMRLQKKIHSAIQEKFASGRTEERRVDGFDMGDYK
jgi:hypothetical protein